MLGHNALSAAPLSALRPRAITGTGTLAVGALAVAGSGQQTEAGTGALVRSVPALSGTGQQTESGTGSLAVAVPAYSGIGIAGIIGQGSAAVSAPSFSGVGQQTETGVGALDVTALLLMLGAGNIPIAGVTGTGDLTIVGLSMSGTDGAVDIPARTGGGGGGLVYWRKTRHPYVEPRLVLSKPPQVAPKPRTFVALIEPISGKGSIAFGLSILSGNGVTLAKGLRTESVPSGVSSQHVTRVTPETVLYGDGRDTDAGTARPVKPSSNTPALPAVAPQTAWVNISAPSIPAQEIAPQIGSCAIGGLTLSASMAGAGYSESPETKPDIFGNPWSPEVEDSNDDIVVIAGLYAMLVA